MRIVLLCMFVAQPVCSMHNEQPPKQVTIIDLDNVSKERFMEMSDEQKWRLHEESRELVRRYLKAVHDKNERIARVLSALECTILDLETNINQLQYKLVKLNPQS